MYPIRDELDGKADSGNPFSRWSPINVWLARKAGVVTVFEKGVVWGGVQDALAFGDKHKKMLGDVKGFFIGEVIWGDPRIEIQLFRPDAREIKRLKKRKTSKHLKKRGIRVWHYTKYLKKNPLDRYFAGKPPLYPPTEEELRERLERRKAKETEK